MQHPTFNKVSLVSRCGSSRCGNSLAWLPLLAVAGLVLFFTACPDNNHPPPMADCDPGYHPCGEDSTECCLDTTSHNFVWEIDTLGDYGSYLNDVAIIDENNIWVVGNIETDSGEFNAARWDGSEWHLVKLLYTGTPPGSHSGTVQPGQAIYALSTGEIFIVAGTTFYWDGNDWEELYVPWGIFNGAVTELWGTSSSDIYFVGDNGSIVHYDGSGFTKMESLPGQGGTEVDLKRIDGQDGLIYIAGYDNDANSVVLEFSSGYWSILLSSDNYLGDSTKGDYGFTSAVDVYGNTVYIVSTQGLLSYRPMTGEWTNDTYLRSLVYEDTFLSISVNNINDIMVFGGLGEIAHFNGLNWHRESQFNWLNRVFKSGQLKDNVVVYVGSFINGGAIVVIGKR